MSIKYREDVVGSMVEVLASKMQGKDNRRPNDVDPKVVNANTGDDDIYTFKGLQDPGYPGWITGNGRGPSLSKSAYATRPMRLAPDTDPLQSGFGYQTGGWLADQAAYGRPRLTPIGGWLSDIGRRPGYAALKGGIGGAAVGAGAGWLMGRDPVLYGGIGALLGSLGSVGAGLFAKASSAHGSVSNIIQYLESDFSLAQGTKDLLIDAVQRLAPTQANALADVLRMAAGSGVASIVAHYLLKLGLVGTSIFALIGAGAGYAFGRTNRNAFGEYVQSGRDPFGRPL